MFRPVPRHPLEAVPRYACAIGMLLCVLVPSLWQPHPTFGLAPLWLVGLPSSAWWALRRWGGAPSAAVRPARGRRAPGAVRGARPRARTVRLRAAQG